MLLLESCLACECVYCKCKAVWHVNVYIVNVKLFGM